MTSSATTIPELLQIGAPDAYALSSPAAKPLTYAELRGLIARAAAALNDSGVGRNDRVALVLDNGPQMAAAFLAITSTATAAPLNPNYRAEEFELYLSDIAAKLLVVESGKESPALAVAERMKIPIARLRQPAQDAAGRFELLFQHSAPRSQLVNSGLASADEVALLLHTSGTTSRPKIVPLTHRNLCASARNIQKTLALSPSDRGMNVMPLFHIHGLVAGLLAPLGAGGEVFCTSGFSALKFFGWMSEARPTWYSGVPTMHQALLARAARNTDVIQANPLRFIRSSSSSLPPQVLQELEKVFGAPVIEAYSMTEASHQMTSNPLPPGKRKPGTVGAAAGPEVCILNEAGDPVAPGVTGEIAIRGANVTAGYENNPEANAAAFTKGWFRTGDQGVMDEEGYLSITGRLKEIINRGGEKISPREVDEVLMDHPAVAQCVTFAVEHAKLGEDVAAVVVLRQNMQLDESALRAFAAVRLADFKVPRQIFFRDEIPKSATGKLQRIGLAKILNLGPSLNAGGCRPKRS